MPRQPAAPRGRKTTVELPQVTLDQVTSLRMAWDLDTIRDVLIQAVRAAYDEEYTPPDRDLAVEIDALAARVAALEDSHA